MKKVWAAAGLAVGALMAAPLWADRAKVSYSTYGTPGLIDMPTAESASDAELATTVFYGLDTTRTTLSFQLLPRLTASFRYTGLEGLGATRANLFDRSFDLHYRLLDETRLRPAVAIGLRDFIGTGIYSSEYVVATKTLGSNVTATAGIGWGRLGGTAGFNGRRNSINRLGGQIEAQNWFKGDPKFFGGVAWQANDKLRLKLEYSSDTYQQEQRGGLLDIKSQTNFGLDYKVTDSVSAQAFYLYGTQVGASVTFFLNPKSSTAPSGLHSAPFPVRSRAPNSNRDLGWVSDATKRSDVRTVLADAMEAEGLVVEALKLDASRAEIHIRNGKFTYNAEAIGRTARILSQVMPDSVETFVVVPVVKGLPASAVEIQRRDLERFVNSPDGSEQILAQAEIKDAPLKVPAAFDESRYPKFTWGFGPYARASYFDPDSPIRIGVGLQLSADYEITPGLILSGAVRHRLGGNIDKDSSASNSKIPKVRSEANIYNNTGETYLKDLTLAYYFRPGKNLYARVTAGYLEAHFGGVSAELLWKPVGSRLAIGAEANYVKQREFEQGFGFRDYEVGTGHISGYLDLGRGFHAQVDAGRYLAGDWGASVSIDREFANGWKVGAYATKTDVSAEDFGEGSFDKGIRLTIPLEPLLGSPSRKTFSTVIQPLSRDGGARVHVDGRLYNSVRGYHASGLESSWGRFWR